MKIYLIILLIIGTHAIISSQVLVEYRDGVVYCNTSKHSNNLKVFLDQSYMNDKYDVQISGDYKNLNEKLVFIPIIPFQKGQKYIAFCEDEKFEFEIPIPHNYSRPSIVDIYPRNNILPSNLLKFHIQFSRPMSRIGYPHIDLLDENGDRIDRALLKEIPELWNDDFTQLTIWIEPGRIKRGLGPNLELGPVLEKGKNYSLRVSDKFRDESGLRLEQDYEKKFNVGEADRTKLNIEDVKLKFKRNDESDFICLDFKESIDFTSSISNLRIIDSNNKNVKGFWQHANKNGQLVFFPELKLEQGNYKILLNAVIEDLAGNNFIRKFDVEINEEKKKESTEQFTISFEVN